MTDNRRSRLALIVFFAIAFGVPWAGWFWLRRAGLLDHMFDSFAWCWFTAAPSVAGLVAAAVEGEFVPFVRRVFGFRFALWLWPLAIVLPLLAGVLTFATHSGDLLRGGVPHWAKLAGTASLMNFFTGPLAEEFGWRGYLLARWSRHRSVVAASLLIGPVWAAWHIPLFYDSVFADVRIASGYLLWVVALSVILGLVVARAKGSVLPSILGHWSANATAGIFFAFLPALPGEAQPGGLAFSLAMAVVALGLAVAWRGSRLKA